MISKSEIESLIYLLDDPDPFVQSEVKGRLFELGEQVVPLLDQHKSEEADPQNRDLINGIIQKITYSSIEEGFTDVLANGFSNMKQLEDAVFILARFDDPTLRISEYRHQLDQYAARIKSDLRYALSATEKLHRLLDLVFVDLGFKGGLKNYYQPDNAHLHKVIDNRSGLPISLALVVLFLARRLDIPFRGMQMPVHFMLMYESEQEKLFVDPFDRGKIINYNQCYYFLKQNGIEPKSKHFQPADESTILARYTRNLIRSYRKKGQEKNAVSLTKLLQTVEMMSFHR